MAENTKIEWANHTFNPWFGCQKVGPGCDHCYAEGWAKRSGLVQWGPGADRRRSSEANWRKPIKWNRQAEIQHNAWQSFKDAHPGLTDDQLVEAGFAKPERPRVFCASLADVFDNAVPDAWRMDLFSLIAKTPHLDWLLVTKRVGNVMRMCSGDGLMFDMIADRVWLGVTICNQEEAERDIPKLMQIPAKVRWLSMEPLLGPVDLGKWLDPWTCSDCGHHGSEFNTGPFMCADCGVEVEYAPEIGSGRCPNCGKDDGTSDDVGGTCPRCGSVRGWSRDYGFKFDAEKPAMLDWVVVGGESGPHARPMNPDWAYELRDQCDAADVPFLFKQLGEWADFEHTPSEWWNNRTEAERAKLVQCFIDGKAMNRIGKKAAGRLLDGVQHDGYPSRTTQVRWQRRRGAMRCGRNCRPY